MAGHWKDKERKNKVRKDAKWNNISCVPIVRNLVSIGFTEADIAIVLEVSPATIAQWKQRYPDLFVANDEGKKVLRGRVFAELVRCAFGYDYTEQDVKYAVIVDDEGKEKVDTNRKVITEHHKHQPKNASLLQLLAQNMMPKDFPRVPIVIENNTLQLITNIEEDKIRAFAGRLLDLANKPKQIESKVIETGKPDKSSA